MVRCAREPALRHRRLSILHSARLLRNELDETSGEEAVAPVDISLQPPLWERTLNGDDLANMERDGVGRRGVVLVHDLRLHHLLRSRRRDIVAHARLAVGKRYVRAVCDALGDDGAEVVL